MIFHVRRENGEEIDYLGLKVFEADPRYGGKFDYTYELEINTFEDIMSLFNEFKYLCFTQWRDDPIIIKVEPEW
jgi:hypothetical protein